MAAWGEGYDVTIVRDHVFIIQGDITQLSVDAIVYSTDVWGCLSRLTVS
jgi:hypothetical protein